MGVCFHGNTTQGLEHVRHALYHSYIAVSFNMFRFGVFWDGGSGGLNPVNDSHFSESFSIPSG